MTSKYVLHTLIILLCFTNYYIVNEYYQKYTFTNQQLSEEKFKCIRYYDSHIYDKQSDITCHRYSHDYVVFILDRAQYINNYIINNVIYICMMMIYTYIII